MLHNKMDLHFTDLKQRHIKINGRQVNINNKSSHTQRLVHPLQLYLKPKSIKLNNSHQKVVFSHKKYPSQFQPQSPRKDVKFCIQSHSSRIQREVFINPLEISCQKKKPYFLFLQETRPQSVSQYEVRKTGFTDFQFSKDFCISPKKDNNTKKIKNQSALAPSLKPRTLSMKSQKFKDQKIEIQKSFKDDFNHAKILHQESTQMSGIEKCLKLFNKGEVMSYDQVDPPIQSKIRTDIINNQSIEAFPNFIHSIDQTKKNTIEEKESFTYSKDKVSESSIKLIYHNNQKSAVAFNKTSFDNEVPPSEGSVKIQQLEINNGVSKTRLFGHRKIQSLFTENELKKSYHQRTKSFDFNHSLVDQLGLEIKPDKKQTLNLEHFSSLQNFVKNEHYFQRLQNEFNKEHQKTNSSISLQEFSPLYQRERQILIKYLESIESRQNYVEDQSMSQVEKSLENEQRQHNCKGMQFLEFVNELDLLEQQKIENNDLSRNEINQKFFSQVPLNLQNSSEQWSLHRLVKIGQNELQINENRMIIHVISVWLKQMGYLKEQTKFHVVHNIKKLLLNVLNLTQQKYNNFVTDLKSDSVQERQQYFQESKMNCTFVELKQKNNIDSLRRYSFNHQQTDFKTNENAFLI